MFNQRQFVVRKRREDLEQLQYPDYYDEYIGMKPTGNIVNSKGVKVGFDERFTNVKSNIIKETWDVPSIEEVESITPTPVVDVKSSIKFLIVEHYYGSTIIDYELNEEDIDLEEYKKEIEIKYWSGFVTSIKHL